MYKPEKAELKPMNVADNKRRQLAQLFPEAVIERPAENRTLVHAVDFEKLKGVLGEFSEVLENQCERYGMTLMPCHKVVRLWKFKLSAVDKWVDSGKAGERGT